MLKDSCSVVSISTSNFRDLRDIPEDVVHTEALWSGQAGEEASPAAAHPPLHDEQGHRGKLHLLVMLDIETLRPRTFPHRGQGVRVKHHFLSLSRSSPLSLFLFPFFFISLSLSFSQVPGGFLGSLISRLSVAWYSCHASVPPLMHSRQHQLWCQESLIFQCENKKKTQCDSWDGSSNRKQEILVTGVYDLVIVEWCLTAKTKAWWRQRCAFLQST